MNRADPAGFRIAFFSPLPPARSGIADYSAALLEPLQRLAEVTTFENNTGGFQPSAFDIALYQVGNNPFHIPAYEEALRTPGVVVLHEANLHHLVADLTIRRNDWSAYLREVEYDGGPAALEFAKKKVQALETGPDYEGVRMLRRILERSRGVIVHSRFVEAEVRKAGFKGPVAVIPHGAWIPEADPMTWRTKLGVSLNDVLIGIFGFLKPYKRIAESLRAFKRITGLNPNVKMILVGEAHPEFPVASIIRSLGLEAHVRMLGFTPAEDFKGYIAACDIVLNLRYPTVGESSGTLLRSLGLGKPVIVSEVGSFLEYPDDVCLKAPVDAAEEDALFELLNLLATRRDLRAALGRRARDWVASECNWERVAGLYVKFLQAVAHGEEWRQSEHPAAPVIPESKPDPIHVEPEYIQGWAGGKRGKEYLAHHLTRLEKTLAITPPGTANDRILEMGAYMQITPALHTRLGYGEVRGCYYGSAGTVEHKEAHSEEGEVFRSTVDLFDAEKDRFPYPCGHFRTVLCCELIEHLQSDPMHMMSEINRVLAPGGWLVLTTPNITSLRAIHAMVLGYHPGFFPAYLRPGDASGARHSREYAPKEIEQLFADSGFAITLLETGPFAAQPEPELIWVEHMLEQYKMPRDLRGNGIYAVGRKTGPVRDRYPGWLYS